MARRPKLLGTEYLKAHLKEEGRGEGDIGALVSEMQLVVPLLFRNLSEQQLLDFVGRYADEFGLQPDYSFARGAIAHLKQWSTEELARYASERGTGADGDGEE